MEIPGRKTSDDYRWVLELRNSHLGRESSIPAGGDRRR